MEVAVPLKVVSAPEIRLKKKTQPDNFTEAMERCSPQQLGYFAPKVDKTMSTHNVNQELEPIPETRCEHLNTGDKKEDKNLSLKKSQRYSPANNGSEELLKASEIAAACELFSKQDVIIELMKKRK